MKSAEAKRFIFTGYKADFQASEVLFQYAVELLDGTRQEYHEKLQLAATPEEWLQTPADLLESTLQSLLLALGQSYWKMHCAPEMVMEGFELTHEQAVFWNTLYTNGLGEFFYKNQIDYRGLVNFPSSARAARAATPYPRTDRSLVPLGGGKDSLVTVEFLKKAGKEFDLFSLGTSAIQKNTAAIVGKPILTVQRTLDPEMIRASKSGEVYNGHVPVSSIYMFVCLLQATLSDYRYAVFSNEQSANAGNVEYLGNVINHQWSKSKEFEMMLRTYVRDFITPDIQVFSLLRPLSELEIARRFSTYTQYFHAFSSCNRNFVVASDQPDSSTHAYWCGECPKCAFVFASLAAFLPKETMLGIVGKDIYADEKLIPLYKELLGVEEFKPFECVGEPDEVRLALYRAYQTRAYEGEPVMEMFAETILPTMTESEANELESKLLSVGDESTLPESFRFLFS